MTWVRCDDGIAWNGKFRRAGLEALGLFVAGLGYCNDHLTDGFIKRGDICLVVPNVPEKKLLALADRLCSNQDPDELDSKPSWIKEAKGWRVHDFHHYQPSRAEVIAARDRERDRKSRWRRRITDSCPGGTDSGTDAGGPAGQTAGQTPVSQRGSTPESAHPVPSRPVPSRPKSATHSTGASVPASPVDLEANPYLDALDRLMQAALPGMLEPGEARISHALKLALDTKNLRFDGEPHPPKGKSRTVTEAVENLEAWALTRRWREGFPPNLDTYLREARFLQDPPSEIPALAPGTTQEHLDRARQLDEAMGL
jgi:hypothetical protein